MSNALLRVLPVMGQCAKSLSGNARHPLVLANLFDTGKDEVGWRCIWMRGRIENVRSGKQAKSHLLTSSASGLRSQCRAHSILGTFPFVRVKPEHEASHIAATVTAKILGQKGEFSSLLASALPLLFLLLTPPAFLTVSPRN